jgi:hypothetical protein
MPASFWSTVANGGGDIRVTTANGETECAREVVSCDTGTDTGELHFLANSVDGTTDTVFYIYADGVSADYAVTDTYGRNAVWSDYTTVLHNAGTEDSTGNHTGYTAGGGVTVGGASGKIGTATDFDGSNDFIGSSTETAMDGDTTQTVQMWINPDVINTRMGIVGKTIGVSNATSAWLVENQATNNGSIRYLNYYGTSANFLDTPANALVNGAWNAFHFTRNGASAIIYKNATSVASSGSWSTASTNNLTGDFGLGRFGAGNFLYFNGKIDEFRYRKAQLSANWITTEYNNQSSPATFYTVGTMEEAGGGYRFVPQIRPFAGL